MVAIPLVKEFGIMDLTSPENITAWNNKKDDLFDAIDGNGDDGQKFIQIYDYENIAKVEE
jgi:hypothetical protein